MKLGLESLAQWVGYSQLIRSMLHLLRLCVLSLVKYRKSGPSKSLSDGQLTIAIQYSKFHEKDVQDSGEPKGGEQRLPGINAQAKFKG